MGLGIENGEKGIGNKVSILAQQPTVPQLGGFAAFPTNV
jgi:hypothetical protein